MRVILDDHFYRSGLRFGTGHLAQVIWTKMILEPDNLVISAEATGKLLRTLVRKNAKRGLGI